MKRVSCRGSCSRSCFREVSAAGLGYAKVRSDTRYNARRRMVKLGRLSLSLCAVAWMATACSNEPLQPSGALWPGGSKAHAGTPGSGGSSRKSVATATRERNGPGWGLTAANAGRPSRRRHRITFSAVIQTPARPSHRHSRANVVRPLHPVRDGRCDHPQTM